MKEQRDEKQTNKGKPFRSQGGKEIQGGGGEYQFPLRREFLLTEKKWFCGWHPCSEKFGNEEHGIQGEASSGGKTAEVLFGFVCSVRGDLNIFVREKRSNTRPDS